MSPQVGHSNNKTMLGPAFLEKITETIENHDVLSPNEWRGRLITPDGKTKFRLRYYGREKGLIVQTDFAPQLLLAVDAADKEYLLFDGCKHGYNALFCDEYTKEQINNRTATELYKDADGNEQFEIIISTFTDINYEDELRNQIDDNGMVEIIDGSKVELDTVKRNGFDSIQIWVINETGRKTEVLSEECS